MKPAEKAQFFTQMATMTRGGVPLSQALASLAMNFNHPSVQLIRASIENGDSVEKAFDRAEFTPFEKSYLSAGNQTGQLAKSFAALADYWQREADLSKALAQAMRYPIFLVHAAILLPPLHLVVDSVGKYLLTAGTALACLYVGVYILRLILMQLWHSPLGQKRLLYMPLIGPFWKSVYLLRWIQVVRMEFEAGLGLPHAVLDAWSGTGSAAGVAFGPEGEKELLAGVALSDLTPRWSLIPKDWRGYLASAELSGQLSNTLAFLEEESEKEYQRRRASMLEWIPKIFTMIVLVGVAAYIVSFWMNYYKQLNAVGG